MTRPVPLPPAQRAVLELLAAEPDDNDGEIVVGRGEAWIGTRRFHVRTVRALLWLACLRDVSIGRDMQRYVINETGRGLLAGHFTIPALRAAIKSGRPFSTGPRGITFLEALNHSRATGA